MMMVRKSKGLSERHHKILDLLQKYAEKGYPPSIREIGEQTGITSTSVVNYYLEQLEKWGYIERDRRISRGLRVVPEKLAELGNALACPCPCRRRSHQRLHAHPGHRADWRQPAHARPGF